MLNIQSNEVKTHFSKVIRKVGQGQGFMIIKHKKVVAKLVPFDEKTTVGAKMAVMAVRQLRHLNLTQGQVDEYKQMYQR